MIASFHQLALVICICRRGIGLADKPTFLKPTAAMLHVAVDMPYPETWTGSKTLSTVLQHRIATAPYAGASGTSIAASRVQQHYD